MVRCSGVREDCTPEISTSGIEIQVDCNSSASCTNGNRTKILHVIMNVGGRNFSYFLASFIANSKAIGLIEKDLITLAKLVLVTVEEIRLESPFTNGMEIGSSPVRFVFMAAFDMDTFVREMESMRRSHNGPGTDVW